MAGISRFRYISFLSLVGFFAILLCGISITAYLFYQLELETQQKKQQQFAVQVEEIRLGIKSQLDKSVHLLRGVSSYYAGSKYVDRNEFYTYIKGLGLTTHYQGVDAVAYIQKLQPADVAAHEEKIRSEGAPSYQLKASTEGAPSNKPAQEWLSSVVYIEPFDWHNQELLGVDLSKDPALRNIMNSAKSSNKVLLTDVLFEHEALSQGVQPHILLFIPLFKKQANGEQVHYGWCFAAIDLAMVLDEYFSVNIPNLDARVKMTINNSKNDRMLYQSRVMAPMLGREYGVQTQFDFYGEVWDFYAEPSSKYFVEPDITLSSLVLYGGLLVTVLLLFCYSLFFRNHISLQKALHDAVVINTELEISKQKIEELAHYDFLTKLPNRAYFMERAEHELSSAKRYGRLLATMFLDLNDFKPLNDQYGHEFGDNVLVEVANRLRDNLRDSDLLCRQGGDEFVVLLPECGSLEDIDEVANKLLCALAAPFSLGNVEINIRCSIGIACYPKDAHAIDDLIRCADAAMYLAKGSVNAEGYNIRFYEPSHQQGAS